MCNFSVIIYRFKCFTYGKKIKREPEPSEENHSKVDILKKRFKKMDLLRKYFAVTKEGKDKKFNFPVDENCDIINQK